MDLPDHGGVNGAGTPGFLESTEFLQEVFEEENGHLDPQLSILLDEDRDYGESFEAQQLEKAHISHRLQNEFRGNSDDESSDVNLMESLGDHVESSHERIRIRTNSTNNNNTNSQNNVSEQQTGNESLTNTHGQEMINDDNPEESIDLNHPLRSEERALFQNNQDLLDIIFPLYTRNLDEPIDLIDINEQAEANTHTLLNRLLRMIHISHQYLGVNRDMTTPDAIFYLASLQRFQKEICEQASGIYGLFEDAAYRYLHDTNVFFADYNSILDMLFGVQFDLHNFLLKMSTIVKDMYESLANPEEHATINLVVTMVNEEAEELGRRNFDEDSIIFRIERHLPNFLSKARLALPYSTPLSNLLSKADIKILTRFNLRDLIEMAVRLKIPRSYSIARFSQKTQKHYQDKIKFDPTMQLFILLVRLSHGLTLKVLQIITGVDFRKLSSVQLALENYLIQSQSQLLNCSKFKAGSKYKKLLSDNTPDTSTPECDLMEEHVAFFIDGTGQKISAPTRDSFTGSEYTYSGKDKIHCLRYQVVCDLFGYIWDVSGPYGGSVHDKTMYDKSRFGSRIKNLNNHVGKRFVVYGDPAYNSRDILSPQLVASHRALANRPLTQIQKLTNQQYVFYRIKIERTFGMLANLFKGLILWFKNKIKLTDCSHSYKLACLFLNCYTVLYRTTNNQFLRQHLDDNQHNAPKAISLCDVLEYWIKPEYRATISSDGTLINNPNEESDMSFILAGIAETERANAAKAARDRQAAESANENSQLTENIPQVRPPESENTNIAQSQ